MALLIWAALLAALLTCLDTALKSEEPIFALRTKEWWFLLFANGAVAFIIIYAARENEKLDPATFLGFFTAVFGYPLLLHAKLFSIRGNDPADDKSVGPQFVLEVAERFCSPGIRNSIDEMAGSFILEWRKADIAKLGEAAKVYIRSFSLPTNNSPTKEEILRWVDDLVTDTQQNPAHAGDNAEALFVRIREIGKLRGTRWVLKQNSKR